MAVAFSNPGANAQDIAFGSSTYTVSSVTISENGYLLWYLSHDNRDITAATLLGQSATKLIEAANTRGEVWAAAVTAGTGDLVATADAALGVVASNWILVTGSSNIVSDSQSAVTSGGDPQILNSVTIPSLGGGVFFVGGYDGGPPGTWANVTRVAAMEAEVGTGNTAGVSGATSTSAGTPSAEATGNVGWSFNADGSIIGLSFAASSADTTLMAQAIF